MRTSRTTPASMTLVLIASLAACGEPRTAGGPGRLATSAPSSTAASAGDGLDWARACAADAECEHLGDHCNAGCSVTVNRKHREAVLSKLATPRPTCVMDCPPVGPPVCRSGLCESPQR